MSLREDREDAEHHFVLVGTALRDEVLADPDHSQAASLHNAGFFMFVSPMSLLLYWFKVSEPTLF